MFAEKLNNALSIIKSSHIKSTSSIAGITSQEIDMIESSLKVTLPTIFKDFLLTCGSSSNDFFIDHGFILYPRIKEYKFKLIKEAIEDNETLPFNEDSIVFKTYQGEEFWFFDCDGTSDPLVFHAEWDENIPESTGITLSQFILNFFSKVIEENEQYKKFNCINIIRDFSYGRKISEKLLCNALDDAELNVDLFKKSFVGNVIINHLLKSFIYINSNSKIGDKIIHLLGMFNVNENDILIAFNTCDINSSAIFYIKKYIKKSKLDSNIMKEILKN